MTAKTANKPPSSRRGSRRNKRIKKEPLGAKSAPPQGGALRNPFPIMTLFSEDYINNMHLSALDVLERLGVKILLPEAREIFKQAGAKVSEDDEMVYIGREIIENALKTAPRSITMKGGASHRDIVLELGNLVFQPGAGCPYANDLERGRRIGSKNDFAELVQLTQYFDTLHMVPPLLEPQDAPTHLRHYATMEAMLKLSDKVPFIYSRGTPQVEESFEMIKNFRGLTQEEFEAEPYCYTIINTNSPRLIDRPMAQGVLDFPKYGQMTMVTPFTLMGAMAPITVAGAITLSHAECLTCIALTQLVRPGAPVCYGTFTSNVDMKSGAPAFGTPEQFQASIAAGQLARQVGLPWRSASGSAANINDPQAANETQFALWGCLLAGSTIALHVAGWLEGGLTFGYEKFITDMEVVNMVASLCRETPQSVDNIAISALEEVAPGGHFFGCAHTMERYRDAFYDHLAHDLSNYGNWKEAGELDASQRATKIWQGILEKPPNHQTDHAKIEELEAYIARRTKEGGAPPLT